MSGGASHDIMLVMGDEIGFHTRTAALFAKTAAIFSSAIRVRRPDNKEANAKSMLGLLALGVKHGMVMTVSANGDDAQDALLALKRLVETNFTLP